MYRIKQFLLIILLSLSGIIICLDGLATKYPSIPFMIEGKIINWRTKAPVSNVTVIAFLNDAIYSINNGFWKQYDYPNFAKSDQSGEFTARTQLYRGRGREKPKKLEIIAFCEGYRTEKFIVKKINFIMPEKFGEWGYHKRCIDRDF